ncbi:putative indole-3-pyruvate monooxygenase YUCCA8 [Lasiodiplodia hormozganensis]|uniref:Indole-3-pyruvate monooxygenase YUCCA8 n=1 Tax=Lasiodiplodia hormozganensis TaxID=869390 RepID=A0AA39U1Q0_9PEZI|nr:putative indole-3-pyruvate monooxygenase YUCCA8 [Lasiodiplodia hormozganensis]
MPAATTSVSPHDYSLHHFQTSFSSVPSSTTSTGEPKSPSPRTIVQTWLDAFTSALAQVGSTATAVNGNTAHLDHHSHPFSPLFHPDAWWRDHLALSWDFRTLHPLPAILDFLAARAAAVRQLSLFQLVEDGKFGAPSMQRPVEGIAWVEAMFAFETGTGMGKGVLRLLEDAEGTSRWKCCMFYTALQELKGVRAAVGEHRPHGGGNSLAGEDGRIMGNWAERRRKEVEFEDGAEPDVLVIGAGQAGLNVAARLKHLGLSCLIIEKNARVGDNWRCRYRTLVTHDPVQYTHMYGLPFPESWPLFTPKDKLADWFEAYASIMELNVWTSTTLRHSEYSDETETWTIEVDRGSSEKTSDGTASRTRRTLHPKHVVFCTGHAGEPQIPHFPGQDSFRGVIYHASQHRDAFSSASPSPSATGENQPNPLATKHIAIIGTGNSGHDIAQNYHEAGAASITLLQRSGTYVLQASTGLPMLHAGLYDDCGPPTADADVYGQSLPIPVQFALNVGLTARIAERERDSIAGLERAGFSVDFGEDGSGIYRKYVTRGGGYYVDVGASRLVVEGKVKVVRCAEGIEGLEGEAVVLADGRRVPADVVVLATGYDNMRTSLRKVMGDRVADRAKDVWDLDGEGEVNAMWRPSGHPKLWFMGGSLALCRLYSRFVALQIKAIEEGLCDPIST